MLTKLKLVKERKSTNRPKYTVVSCTISNVKLDLQLQLTGVVHHLYSFSMITPPTLHYDQLCVAAQYIFFHQQLSQMQSINTKIKYNRIDSKNS